MKNLLILFSLINFQLAFSQADFCFDYNDKAATSSPVNTLDNWNTINGNLEYSNLSSQEGMDDLYLRAYDGSGGSWAYNTLDFNGDWSSSQGEQCLCYDFKIFKGIGTQDFATRTLYLFKGSTPPEYEIMAYFNLSTPLTINDDWATICPPLDFLDDNGNLPSNSYGEWVMYGTSTINGWDSLIQDISGIGLRLDLPDGGPTEIYGYDNICIENCESACGQITNDTLTPIFTSSGDHTYSFQLENNTEYNVTGIVIQQQGDPLNSEYINLYQNPIAPGELSDTLIFDILMDQALLNDSTVCLDITYLSGGTECCHFEHCIIIEPIDLCEEELVSTEIDEEGDCCYSLTFNQGFFNNHLIRIETNILTEGVQFDSIDVGLGGWVSTVNADSTSISWGPIITVGGGIPNGTYSGFDFCLTGVISSDQYPQYIEVNWIALDENGETFVACTEVLELFCAGCLFADGGIECGDNGGYTYDFTIINNAGQTATSIIFENHTPDVIFEQDFFDNIMVAPGESYSGSVAVYNADGSPLEAGELIEIKVLLLGDDGWCCHLDDVVLEVPDCQQVNCDCGEEQAFFDAVAQGASIQVDCANGICILTPNATGPCDTIIWNLRLTGTQDYQTQILPTNESPLFDIEGFPNNNQYEFEMQVLRYNEEGELCFDDMTNNVFVDSFDTNCDYDPFDNPYIVELHHFEELRLYPVPAKNKLNIDLPTTSAAQVEIIGVNGRIHRTIEVAENSHQRLSVDISDLRGGMYFVKYWSGTEQVEQRFVKME